MGFVYLPISPLAVVPVLVGPLQVLFAVLPGILVALGTLALSLFKPRVMLQMLRLAWRLKIPLVAALGGVALVVWGVQALVSASARGGAETEFMSGEWPMFRGGLARRGRAPGEAEPNSGGVVWMHKQGSEGFFSSPAVVGERVYVASAEVSAFGSKGRIYCFDAASGAVVWTARPERYAATFSSPAVKGDYLVCGEGLHTTANARVVCLAVGEGSQGETLWTHATASHVECSPVIDGERVYVNAGDDGVYCLHLAPQPEGTSQLIWHVPGEQYVDAETSLAVTNGRVYVGLGLGGRSLRMLDAETGKELKRLDTPYPVFGPPAIVNNRLYVGMGNGDYVNTAEEAREKQIERMQADGKSAAEIEAARKTLGPAGEVWCVDAETFAPVWKLPVGQTVLGAVAVTNDGLYFATRTGEVHHVSLDGKPLAQWPARAAIIASPAVTEHYVYVVTNRGTLYALGRETLEPVWEAPIGSQPLCISSPTVAHGHVYLGTQYDGFLCVGEPGTADAERSAPLWAGPLGGAGKTGNVDNSPLPERMEVSWQFQPKGDDGKLTTVVAPIAAGDKIVAPLAGVERGLACLSAATLEPFPAPLWKYTTKLGVKTSPVIVGELVLAIDGREENVGRELHAVNLKSGKKVWSLPVSPAVPGMVCGTTTQVIAQVEPDSLTGFTLAGERAWASRIGRLDHPPAITANIIVVAASGPRTLAALDLLTGQVLWRTSPAASLRTGPVVSKDRIYVGTESGVVAFSLLDGSPLPDWFRDATPAAGELCVQAGILAYANNRGEIMIVDPEDGHLLHRVPDAVCDFPPLVSRDALVFVGHKALLRINWKSADAEPEEWCPTDDLGAPLSPLVLYGSSLYQGRAEAGLVRWGAAP